MRIFSENISVCNEGSWVSIWAVIAQSRNIRISICAVIAFKNTAMWDVDMRVVEFFRNDCAVGFQYGP